MNQISIFLFCCVLTLATSAQAQSRRLVSAPEDISRWTYDIGASSGNYNGNKYSEINLGLNWNFSKYLTWRNSGFTRFGTNTDTIYGLDSSARFTLSSMGDSGFGFNFFLGPGYRFSTTENSAAFGETGLTIKLAGLSVGVGGKVLYYSHPGKNANGTDKPKTDSNIFLILAGGGAF